MVDQIPETGSQSTKRRSLADLLFWLAMLPVILGTLVCFGQLALLVNVGSKPANTASLLKVDYLPWPYDLVPAINIPALIEDIERDERASGMVATPAPTVAGTYWIVPTPTDEAGVEETEPPVILPPTATEIPPEPNTPQPTATRLASRTATRQPSATLMPSPSATRTATWPPAPTFTPTDEPEPPRPTNTPRPTQTRVPTRTRVPTSTPKPPTPTNTPITPTATPVTPTATPVTPTATVPSSTPETPTVEPVYVPVQPISEIEGPAEVIDGGCRAYFGYFNGNVQEVDIPLIPPGRNELNIDVEVSPPTHFLVGRQYNVFSVDWSVPTDLIWRLDGREAVAGWCNPPSTTD